MKSQFNRYCSFGDNDIHYVAGDIQNPLAETKSIYG